MSTTPRILTDKDRETSHYVGDGLYTRIENGYVVLFSTDGITVHDEVFLDEPTMISFIEILRGLLKKT